MLRSHVIVFVFVSSFRRWDRLTGSLVAANQQSTLSGVDNCTLATWSDL